MGFTFGLLAGIIIGIVGMIAYSQWLSERLSEQQDKRRQAAVKSAIQELHRVMEATFPRPNLEQQLKDAIDREDYEEAERIKALIKKQ